MERGQVDDFVIAWSDRGEVENYLLRNGQTCWMGAESEEGITWSNSLGWRGRLEASQGSLSLSTERPSMVRGLGDGEVCLFVCLFVIGFAPSLDTPCGAEGRQRCSLRSKLADHARDLAP